MIPLRTERDGPNACEPHEPLEGNYFVAAYPPFSVWTREQAGDAVRVLNDPAAASAETPLGLYIHIPFCAKRCDYCYYLSSANASAARVDDYVATIGDELSIHARSAAFAGRASSFAYIGGGTPSLLSERALARLFGRLSALNGWDGMEEVSFECAPKSVTDGKLRLLRERGVTRVSLGVQAMDDDVLKRSGRIHLCADVMRAYVSIRRIGFPIANVDLIVGLVGETDASFFASLDRVITMQPESVTIYQLEIPYNTPLSRAMREEDNQPTIASWNAKRRRLGEAFARLEACGYRVRSAYTAVRDPVGHRFLYQDAQYRGADLLGIGLSSFSYVGGTHFQNETEETAYVAKVRAGIPPIGRAYGLNDAERVIREFVLQLKLGSINPNYFLEKFNVVVGEMFRDPINELSESGWLVVRPNRIELTRAGLLRVDRLLSRFYRPCHQSVRYT